ncbi:ABC transporter ATP-binding protein [Rhodococcus qingshengii]|uniref:ABC transporter ATP-binding protein n=1 Tax=Rhodococcus qingshengii TaxID=334542 RepID=UPI0010A67075|nr:sn-glycerol-3-phosphate ABC transporter ATP-binding protein UgpC [Rhodococcus qingshengii]THJ66921.1 sn-glycerol-3-phosphate ABC transporter ATP-binding protein UgpC [Rhodococcus qingshengii]
MADVTFDGVKKVYPGGKLAVDDLSLHIADGEFMVFVGPSGCGKTTALRMLAGLEDISGGEIRIGDRRINEVEVRKRDIAMVFQNYALYPHMTNFDNIAFPLRSRGVPRQEVKARVDKVAGLLGLGDLLSQRPKTLSGGQRQRVAMGRAMVRQPEVFLMDEPLSNLDAKLRTQMRAEIGSLQRELGTTTIYVTHDQVEAMTMGTRIAVMRHGVLQQEGPPQELFSKPSNLFVASFIGSPAMNLFQARIDTHDGRLACIVGTAKQPLALPDHVLAEHPRLSEYKGRDVAVGIRPDYLAHTAPADDVASGLNARVTLAEVLGAEQLVHLELDAEPVINDEIREIAKDADAVMAQELGRDATTHRVPIVARMSADLPMAIGATKRLTVQPERLHFFDLSTGASLRTSARARISPLPSGSIGEFVAP